VDTHVRLKHSKGLTYIAYLLRYPGMEFHALDLADGIASGSDKKPIAPLGLSQKNLETGGFHIGGLGDAGEVLDDQAKRAYRQRLSELQEELEEAKALCKVERAEELEAEIDWARMFRSVALGLARCVSVGRASGVQACRRRMAEASAGPASESKPFITYSHADLRLAEALQRAMCGRGSAVID
jgi:uncharacterized membrane protein